MFVNNYSLSINGSMQALGDYGVKNRGRKDQTPASLNESKLKTNKRISAKLRRGIKLKEKNFIQYQSVSIMIKNELENSLVFSV